MNLNTPQQEYGCSAVSILRHMKHLCSTGTTARQARPFAPCSRGRTGSRSTGRRAAAAGKNRTRGTGQSWLEGMAVSKALGAWDTAVNVLTLSLRSYADALHRPGQAWSSLTRVCAHALPHVHAAHHVSVQAASTLAHGSIHGQTLHPSCYTNTEMRGLSTCSYPLAPCALHAHLAAAAGSDGLLPRAVPEILQFRVAARDMNGMQHGTAVKFKASRAFDATVRLDLRLTSS